ncbi:cobalamin-dependent protein [Caloramator sp. mosi_1]|uniref:B12-binding domain-containing radical SAM protein n=1 Tax=Caloramator sp. mosi_1 TaxID=3023090 RepID=UPI0023619205|nr:cobalamin-dependent protein [Caloramator sp. mosi_1]WDC83492.1 cobalamin-dependent protein [Caloramator sp. mosi_1]
MGCCRKNKLFSKYEINVESEFGLYKFPINTYFKPYSVKFLDIIKILENNSFIIKNSLINQGIVYIEAVFKGEEIKVKNEGYISSIKCKICSFKFSNKIFKREIEEYDVELYESSINDDILKISFDISQKEPDVVAFSCYIWNIENTLKVADTIKNINENIKIVLGGPEVSFDSIELLNKYSFIDFIIKGEGERVIKPLIDCIHMQHLEGLKNIKGLTYKENNKIIDTGFADTIIDLDSIKFPMKMRYQIK